MDSFSRLDKRVAGNVKARHDENAFGTHRGDGFLPCVACDDAAQTMYQFAGRWNEHIEEATSRREDEDMKQDLLGLRAHLQEPNDEP